MAKFSNPQISHEYNNMGTNPQISHEYNNMGTIKESNNLSWRSIGIEIFLSFL
jgi:hypothetical protein